MVKILIMIFLGASITEFKAQIDTTLREYFPLEIGNYWEYRDNLFETWTIEAIKDTIMPNGKTYTVLKDSTSWSGGTIFYYYYRMDDSMKVWEYVGGRPGNCDSEYLIFDLTLPDSTFWTTCISPNPFPEHNFPCIARTQTRYYSSLNLLTSAKTFCGALVDTIAQDTTYCGSFYYPLYELAKGIGLAYRIAELGNAIFITGAIINGVQYGTITNVDEKDHNLKDGELSFEIYPNPFNSETIFSFTLSKYSDVKINLYDILGKEIAVIFNESLNTGKYQQRFNPANIGSNSLSSGIYLVTFQVNKDLITKKLIILK
ncbi:MAG: T9SS type A sorting domain-containing protein [Bacteroidetes bacterium]|nr:T9SS type A sorting domain-containing protein [Bacteroidota bacterium]